MKQLLIKLNACQEAKEWASDKTWEEIYNTCHRGDWLLWLHQRTNKKDLQVRTLAKGHCANTVTHLMQDERSIVAIDTAIAFGEGRATRAELDSAARAAARAADVAFNSTYSAYSASEAAYYAADASYYAADAYSASEAASAAANAAEAAADAAAEAAAEAAAAAAAKIKNQKETADIVRKYIPIELWNVQKMIDTVNKQI